MKKLILLSVAALLMLMPGMAYANGTWTLTIAPNGLSFTVTPPEGWDPKYDGGFMVIFCDGSTYEEGDVRFYTPSTTFHFIKPISYVMMSIGEVVYLEASRNCETAGAEPLFMMWLLTRGDQGCILLSETHPSVERQKALCFPATDPDWVADNAPCADYVYDNDTWSCDAFGFSRLPLYDEDGPDLWEVWQRHAARQEE